MELSLLELLLRVLKNKVPLGITLVNMFATHLDQLKHFHIQNIIILDGHVYPYF